MIYRIFIRDINIKTYRKCCTVFIHKILFIIVQFIIVFKCKRLRRTKHNMVFNTIFNQRLILSNNKFAINRSLRCTFIISHAFIMRFIIVMKIIIDVASATLDIIIPSRLHHHIGVVIISTTNNRENIAVSSK